MQVATSTDNKPLRLNFRAVGQRVRKSRWDREIPFSPDEIVGLSQNAHLRHHINTLMPQVFPSRPLVHVVDQDGEEPCPDLSKIISDSADDCGLFASMRRAYMDCLLYGCAVRSVAYTALEDAEWVRISEIRDLPAATFCNAAPRGGNEVLRPNQLMPGLIIRNGQPEAYQTDSYYGTVHKLEDNWDVICDPTAPQPYGEAFCLPIYSILDSLAIAEAAADASVQRTGVPLLCLKINDQLDGDLLVLQDEITEDGETATQTWGMTSGFVLPRGINPAPINQAIVQGVDARERILDLDGLLDSYFSPASALSPGRADQAALFGASQQSRAQIWRAHIAGQQAWIEEAYERLLSPILKLNGCPDEWRLEIRLERPSEDDRPARMISELQLAVSAGAISVSELRERLETLDLPKELPEDLMMAYPIGNVAPKIKIPYPRVSPNRPQTPEEALPTSEKIAEATEIAADAQEDAVLAAIRARAKAWRPRMEAWLKEHKNE